MIKAIRGYKLILWGNRLGLKDTSMIAPKGINYIHSISPTDDEQISRVILYVETREEKPLAVTFQIDNSDLSLLTEIFEFEEPE